MGEIETIRVLASIEDGMYQLRDIDELSTVVSAPDFPTFAREVETYATGLAQEKTFLSLSFYAGSCFSDLEETALGEKLPNAPPTKPREGLETVRYGCADHWRQAERDAARRDWFGCSMHRY